MLNCQRTCTLKHRAAIAIAMHPPAALITLVIPCRVNCCGLTRGPCQQFYSRSHHVPCRVQDTGWRRMHRFALELYPSHAVIGIHLKGTFNQCDCLASARGAEEGQRVAAPSRPNQHRRHCLSLLTVQLLGSHFF